MRHGFNYVVEKLTKAVYCLAVGTGSQQSRLHGAFLSFQALKAEDFPEGDLRESWESVKSRLTALEEPSPNVVGDVRHTLNRMSDEEALDLAKDIVELCFGCRSFESERKQTNQATRLEPR